MKLPAVLAMILGVATAQAVEGGDVAARFWASPDNRSLYVAMDAPEEPAGPRLYFFGNDADRLCYTFAVSGRWRLDPAAETMVSDDGRGTLGQSLRNAAELGATADADLVAAVTSAYQAQFAQSLAALEKQGFTRVSRPSFTIAPLPGSARSAFAWSAVAEARWQGRPAPVRQHAVFAPVSPGWVIAIEASDDVAREVVDTLGVAAAPDCYRPFIRQNFPQVPLQ